MQEDFVTEDGVLTAYMGRDACVAVPEGTVRIAPGALRDRKQQIRELILPSTLQEIGPHTFSGCRALQTVSFGENLRVIDAGAFADCEALSVLRLPDSLEKVRRSAFSGCRALEEVRLPSHLRVLADGIFFGCRSLREVKLPEGLEIIGNTTAVSSVDGGPFAGSGLVSLVIPASVKAIGTGAFLGCSHLRDVYLPAGLEIIGPQAFSGCSALEDLRIPPSVRMIGAGAFRGISHPESIALPRSLEKMRQPAGLRCSGIYHGLHIENGELLACDPDLETVAVPSGVTRIAAGALNALADEAALHRRQVRITLPETLEVFERSRLADGTLQFVFPDGYLRQLQPLPLPFTAELIRSGHLQMEMQDAASLYLFQAEMLSDLAAQRLSGHPEQAARVLFAVLKKQRTRRALLRGASFVKCHREALSGRTGEAFYALMRRAGEGAAAVRAARCVEPTDLAAAERYCRDAHPEDAVDAVLAEAGLDPQSSALKDVRGRSGEKADPHLVKCLFLPYLVTLPHVRRPDLTSVDLESAELEKCLDLKSVSGMLDTFMPPARLFENPRWLKAYCRFADTLQIASFDRRLRTLSFKNRLFSWGSMALTLSDTREAMCRCSEYAGGNMSSLLEHWCRLRGKKVPFQDGAMHLRLAPDGRKEYVFAGARRTAGIGDDLRLEVRDADTGEILRDDWKLPAPEAARLREDLAETAGRLEAFAAAEREALRQRYIFGEPLTKRAWEYLYLKDPVRAKIASGLIWTQGPGRSFVVMGGRALRADGTPLPLYAHTGIRLAHPLEMEEEELASWQARHPEKTFLDQTGERLHPEEVPADYCSGLSITVGDKEAFERLFGCPSRGFSRLKAHRLDLACELDTGAGTPPHEDDEVHLGSLCVSSMDRTTNTALNFLETKAIRRRIAQDDPAVISLLERRGLRPAEVRKCLQEAVRRKARQVTALLLEVLERSGRPEEDLTLD